LYPGTSVPADFTLEITRRASIGADGDSEFGSVSLTSAFLNLSTQGSLDAISGLTQAGQVPAFSLQLANQGTVTSAGGAATTIAKPGGFSVAATGIASAALLGEAALSVASLSITVIPALTSSLFQTTPPLRTAISFTSSPGVFIVPPPSSQTLLGAVTKVVDLFTSVDVELGVEADGSAVSAFSFGGSSSGTQFQLQLSDTIVDRNGNTPTFPLSRAIQTCVFDTDTTRIALTASLNPQDAMVRVLGIGFQLATASEPNSQFAWAGSQSTSAFCSLPAVSAVPLLDGGIVVSQQNLTVSVLGQGVPVDATRDVNRIRLGPLSLGEPRVSLQTISFELLRAYDLLDLRFSGAGLALTAADDGTCAITSIDPARPGQLTVTFAPQHLAERDYYRADPNFAQPGDPGDDSLDPPPIPVRMAGPSHLAFQFPQGYAMPFTVEGLLRWSPLTALPPAMGFEPPQNFEPNPFPPTALETGIELPYRIFLSPNQSSGWSHDPPAASDGEWNPVWHARLGVRKPTSSDSTIFFVDERDTTGNLASRTVRPVFSWDYFPPPQPFLTPPIFPARPPDNDLDPFRMAVTLSDRFDIIERSAYTLNKSSGPEPVKVARLMLSALGAWFTGSVTWADQSDPDPLEAWRHVSAQGRDQYVRVAKRGHLYPFGHAASWVSISERQFTGGANNPAYLIERDFVVIAQKRRDYASLQQFNWNGRDLPITEIEILTETTPPLDAPSSQTIAGTSTGAFWIFNGGGPFAFQMRAFDIPTTADPSGRLIPLQAAAIFVPNGSTANDIQLVSQAYAASNARAASAGGHKVTMAPSSVPGDTAHAVRTFKFLGGLIGAQLILPNGEPSFYPSVGSAIIDLPAVQQLASVATDLSSGTEIQYLQSYLDNGLDAGTETFASLASSVGVGFQNDSANGVGSPSMQIAGLSRKFGTVAGQSGLSSLQNLVTGQFNPADFFQPDAIILGTFPISSLVQPLLSDLNVPTLKLDTSDPTQLIARFTWTPQLNQGFSVGPAKLSFSPNFNPVLPGNPTTALTMTTTIATPINPQQAADGALPNVDAKLTGRLQNFQLNFLDLVVLTIDQLTFTAEKGKKPTLDVTLDNAVGVSLGPSLGLLETLADALAGLLGGGPSIDVSSGQIVASYSLALPSIGLGVFSLENIALVTSLTIPLTSAPLSFSFSFSSKADPFTVTVEMIGGGGYFEIAADVQRGLLELTFEIQAGVAASIDLGLASGSVSIMIGVLLQLGTEQNAITGYFRADGELTVLRLVSLHVMFYLGLTYDFDSGALWGEAEVTVEVSVLFFDESVTLTMRKQFAGPTPSHSVQGAAREGRLAAHPQAELSGRPPFGSIMTENDWQTFANAFA
jgi:hypothetical protein